MNSIKILTYLSLACFATEGAAHAGYIVGGTKKGIKETKGGINKGVKETKGGVKKGVKETGKMFKKVF